MKAVLFVLLAIALVPVASAVGIGPVSVELHKGSQDITIHVINNEPEQKNVQVEVTGPLAGFVELPGKSIAVAPNSIYNYNIKVNLPDAFEGDYAEVNFIEQVGGSGGAGLSAFTAIGVRLYISNPKSGAGGLQVFVTNSSLGEPVRIQLSLSSEQPITAEPKLGILDSGTEIFTRSFGTKQISGTEVLTAVWVPDIEGVFKAKAQASELSAEKEFAVGQPNIGISDAYVVRRENKTLVTVLAKSNWNRPIPARVSVSLNNESASKDFVFEDRNPKYITFELSQPFSDSYALDVAISWGSKTVAKTFGSQNEEPENSLESAKSKTSYLLLVATGLLGAVILGALLLKLRNRKLLTIMLLFLLLPIAGAVTGEVRLGILSPCYWGIEQNWNLFSFCSELSNTSIANVTAPVSGQFDYILRWNSTSQAYELYSVYASGNPFDSFDLNESYFIHFNNATQLPLRGVQRGDLNLTLEKLWNAPTYPYEFTSNVSQYLQTIEGFNYMLKWNSSSQSYVLYSVFSSIKPFSTISRGEGQFIYTNTSGATLEYDRSALGG